MSTARTELVSSIVFVLCWSSGFVGSDLAAGTGAPLGVLAWRFAALAVLLGVACLLLRMRFERQTLRRHAPLGVLNQLVYLGLVFVAVAQGVPAGLVALVASLQPLVVSAVAGPLLGERTSGRQRVGLVIGLAGVALVVGGDLDGSAPWWAYALPFAAMLSLTSGTVLERRWRTREPVLQVVTVQSLVAALGFWVAAGVTGEAVPPPDPQFWVAVAWLVVLSSIGGYGSYLVVSRRQGATRVSTLLYLTPPTVMVWAYLQLGDTITATGLVGMAVCAAGVTLALWSRRGPRADAPVPAAAAPGAR